MSDETKESVEEKEVIDFRSIDPAINDIITLLKDKGAYSNMTTERDSKVYLEKAYNNIFLADFTTDSSTLRSDLLRSHLVNTVSDQFASSINLPLFETDPINTSVTAYTEKTAASVAKSLLLWFIRVSGYESVYKDGLFEMCPYGDSYISPFIIDIPGKDFVFPGVEDRKKENLMLDPNCSQVNSESYSKQAQYYAYSQIYPELNLISRFGEDILEHVSTGAMIDDGRIPNDGESVGENNFYEVLEIQNKATRQEFILLGGNAFPAVRNSANNSYMNAEKFEEEVRKEKIKLPDEIIDKLTWTDDYKYEDKYGRPILTLGGSYFYFRDKHPYNRGIAHKLTIPQVMHEIIENLKTDNIIKRLDQIAYITGGNSDKNEANFRQYRQQKRLDRTAILYLHSSLNNRNVPQPGVIKFEGLTAQEGQQITQDILDFAKNCSGVDPQQAEVQKNIALGQTEIIEEKSVKAIQDIAEKNIPNFEAQLNIFLSFIIAHKGFGMDEVKLNFTKYDEHTPEGNDAATITIPKAAEMIKTNEFKFIVDKSSLVKKSKFLESQQLIDFLALLDPQADPEGFIAIRNKIGETKGITMPEASAEAIALSKPRGGKSQFTDRGAEAGEEPIEEEINPLQI